MFRSASLKRRLIRLKVRFKAVVLEIISKAMGPENMKVITVALDELLCLRCNQVCAWPRQESNILAVIL